MLSLAVGKILGAGASTLLIHISFSASVDVNTQVATFQLFIDAVAVRGAGIISASGLAPNSGAIVYKATGLAAGAHTIQLRVTPGGGSTVRVRPTGTINEHASLLVEEVTV